MFVKIDELHMNRFFFTLLLIIAFSFGAFSQKYSFVYLESETKDPFYVLLNGKMNYSSSLSGFLTIPQLMNGTYDAEVGFVKNKYPEQHFVITIDNQDLGFVLKKINDSTFGLLNLQTFNVISAINTISDSSNINLSKLERTPQPTTINLNKSSLALKLNQTPKCIIASESDFIALRKVMAASNTEADMIELAKLAFKERCFSVEQIKSLSTLIINEQNKLIFFLDARQNIYDANNFSSLQSQITNPAILTQFRNSL